MARDYIKIDTSALQSRLLLNYIGSIRQAYDVGVRVKDIMTHNNDGSNFGDIETLFGVPAGKGQVIFDLVNGSLGSMTGVFQVDDAKEITERVG